METNSTDDATVGVQLRESSLRSRQDNADFRHPHLQTTGRQIRLVSVSNISPSSLLQCRLEVVSLENTTPYIALSYQWGEEKATETISVNGQPFRIRPNLRSFLQNLQGEVCHPIFIDAVCINQNDSAECSHQVSLMGDIYFGAVEVIAWLGEEPLETKDMTWPAEWPDRGSTAEEEWFQRMGPYDYASSDLVPTVLGREHEILVARNRVSGAQIPESVLLHMIEASYWSRLWIVQELLLAKRVLLKCGKFMVDADDFTSRMRSDPDIGLAMNKVESQGVNAYDDGGSMRRAISLLLFRQRGQFHPLMDDPRPLHKLLVTFEHQQSTVDRDKIYGLIGLAATTVEPQYDLPVTDLYLYVLVEGLIIILAAAPNEPLRAGATEVFAHLRNDTMSILLEEDWSWQLTAFNNALVNALRVDFSQPSIMISTARALEQCGLDSLEAHWRLWAGLNGLTASRDTLSVHQWLVIPFWITPLIGKPLEILNAALSIVYVMVMQVCTFCHYSSKKLLLDVARHDDDVVDLAEGGRLRYSEVIAHVDEVILTVKHNLQSASEGRTLRRPGGRGARGEGSRDEDAGTEGRSIPTR